ncbi:MAG TPA: YidB family protein [Rubrivivax sp.]|nr:YidB family protein [Rubrivivax sp.]HPP83018.1 YidB family protein [Rubrivivax sp.]
MKEPVMGLLDSLVGALGQGGAANPQGDLLKMLIGMLSQGGAEAGSGAAAPGGLGGLGGLLEAFARNGLGHVADSWVGSGQNLPVSADQLSQVLGSERVGQMANQLGLNPGDLLGQLVHLLPQVVDKVTPQGQVPQGDLAAQLGGMDLGKMLGSLLRG